MTRMKTTLLLIALLLLLATTAQASQQTYHWAVPSDGWEVHHYIVEIRTDAGVVVLAFVYDAAYICYYIADGWCQDFADGVITNQNDVRYWIPLPAPPGKEEP